MAGMVPAGADRAVLEDTLIANLRWFGARAAAQGITVLMEPLNTIDAPGYFYSTTAEVLRLVDRIGLANVMLQLDLYHVQIMEGDLARHIEKLAGRYGHVQIAGNPGRFEPDVGEINYPYLFERLDAAGYDGWIGCEYKPKAATRNGLGWARPYGIS
jgi:hydroxypyruvate isomerase